MKALSAPAPEATGALCAKDRLLTGAEEGLPPRGQFWRACLWLLNHSPREAGGPVRGVEGCGGAGRRTERRLCPSGGC